MPLDSTAVPLDDLVEVKERDLPGNVPLESSSHGDRESLDERDDKTAQDVSKGARVDRKLRDLSDSEVHQFEGLKREHWWQLWRPSHSPPPPKASLDDAEVIPLAYVSILSKLTFWWVTPIMIKGYQRPLQATDLWKMDPSREAGPLSTAFLEALERRQMKAQEWNESLSSQIPPLRLRARWRLQGISGRFLPDGISKYGSTDGYADRIKALEQEWRGCSGRRKGSIAWALNDVMHGFWSGGVFKVAGDVSQLMIPLLLKALINFSKEVYAANHSSDPHPNIGRGIGMAIGLFFLTIIQSVCQHQFFFRSMAIGVLARATLISATYKRSLSLGVGGRAKHPNGKLLTYVSSDISRIDYCAQWFHAVWTAPIQLTITLILLIIQIGPSALIGFSLFIILAPLQTRFMKWSFVVRKMSMKWTDSRAKLLRELLSSMEIIKVFTYEIPFLKRLKGYRRKEMVGIRKILYIRAANQALAFSVPSLASVLAFVTYASTHDSFDPALIFTSLAFFNLLRQPLMFLPRALSSLTDAQNAIERLSEFFEADTIPAVQTTDPSLDVAIRVQDATFSWGQGDVTEEGGKVFQLDSLNLEVPRGQIVAVVGPVGSGKSSLLQGLIGEMSTISGQVKIGGRLAYCQQSAWIQNATVRDNIMFGQPWEEDRYWEAIRKANLIPDLEILPDGDLTEIGEKGINLSGGQKQRVNIARALYFNADIILFDDPLSAVDPHVGRSLFEGAILPLSRSGKTVILVTHAVHFLPAVDRIYVMADGRFVESGTYAELMRAGGAAADLFSQFGGSGKVDEPENTARPVADISKAVEASVGKASGTGKLEGRLMTSETRKTGSVGYTVYAGYLHAGRSRYTLPITLLFSAIMQTSQVLSTVWLTWWESNHFDKPLSLYEGVYAVLGVTQALFTFAMGAALGILANLASRNLHSSALENVFYSPKSVFDTQPLGRILGIFGKDIDTIDNQLPDSLRMMMLTLVTLIGSVVIITVYLHYFIAVIVVLGIGYWYFALFYRTSSREVKRLDSMLRSLLYSHFSESLSGLATIRAYGETDRFIRENTHYMDLEDRAYLLNFLGACLVFAVAVMCAKGGGGLKPSEIALCLTYLTSITQVLGMVTRQSAEVENNMNAVERLLWYSSNTSLPQEPPHHIKDTEPSAEWPSIGAIQFKDVVMSYRPGLAPVLKGLSIDIQGGEKIGIIGRTGAGKTSITMALFRLVEVTSGTITIDGADIAKLGLNTLRSRIAIIPQDPVLFSGILRSNLDPFDLHDDAKLNDALVRACVTKTSSEQGSSRLSLDYKVEEEGQNLSVGERSLVSLARALVKDSKIVVLDEATAAVDLETDNRIQETIHREFKGKTILCIAHRLRTIISWDRILVMNAGEIEEFATPLELYNSGGLFRSMCEKSDISVDDILRARRAELDGA